MRIDLSSLMFNMEISKGGGTPSWGTALGQSVKEEHRLTYKGCEEIIVGMVYKKVFNNADVYCPLGKGGNKQSDYEYVLSSVFEKIYVNDVFIPNSRFVLLIVKQLNAQAVQHIGRRTLKYSPKMTFCGEALNRKCFDNIKKELNLSDSAAWFVSDINIVNQDELHFTAKIVDANSSMVFSDSEERKAFCEDRAEIVLSQDIFVKPLEMDELDDEPIIVKSSKSVEINI